MKLYNESYLGANLQLTIMYLRTVCVYLYTHVVSSWNETENYTELFKVFAFSLSQQAHSLYFAKFSWSYSTVCTIFICLLQPWFKLKKKCS